MTVDEKPPDTVIARYRAEMSRKRAYYYAAVSAVAVAVVVIVAVAWSHGEITHVTLRTAADPAPSVALQAPSSTVTQAWRSDDHTASGTPYWGGTVVTHDLHSVRGRNAATGAVTWSYTRDNRAVCGAYQAAGVTVAVFELDGNCDQVTTLDSATGKRKWTRTLDENGDPINGRAAVQVTQYTIMFTTPSVVYAIDPVSGIDRWVFSQDGCTVQGAALGSDGALISQTCDKPDCSGLKFCGSGQQLLFRDANNSRDDSSKDNPDRIKWNLIGNAGVPVSGDQLVSAYYPSTGSLQVFDSAKGTALSTITLAPAPSSADGIDRVTTAHAELIHIGGVTYAVDLSGKTVSWATPTPVLPSVMTPGTDNAVPDLSSALVAVPTSTGIALLDGSTGKPRATYSVAAPSAGSSVYPFGTGFVVAGETTTVYR